MNKEEKRDQEFVVTSFVFASGLLLADDTDFYAPQKPTLKIYFSF